MNKYNTVLGQMLDLIPRSGFEKLVKEYKTEHGAKGLKSWTQFVTMLFSQISGQHGLRSIEQSMNNQQNSWYHLGITKTERRINRSTMSYANAHRNSDLFKALFEKLVEEAQLVKSSHGFKFKNPLYSFDSTIISLCMKLFPWAENRRSKGGIKLTVKLDHQGKIPCFVLVSNAREHDVNKIWDIPYNPGDVLVFDRGYTNYRYFTSVCEKKAWFITRLKAKASYKCVRKRAVKEGGNVISDYEIIIPSFTQKTIFRKIIVRDPETKKKITVLTNNLQWSSETVASVYRDRWNIEIFFKAIKQNLKIKRFYGNSKNAVMTQIWIALIAYLLFYLIKSKFAYLEMSFTNFISVFKTILFQRVSLFDLICGSGPPYKPKQKLHGNLEFVW